MKKTFYAIISLFLLSNGLLAEEGRFQRVLEDKVLLSTIEAVEKKYSSTCDSISADKDIKWFCLNGPECFYQITTKCPSQVKAPGYNKIIEFNGVDNGFKNDIENIKITTF